MKRGDEFKRKEHERERRRKAFHLAFGVFTILLSGILIWKLRSLILPITVGALLAFLFRPVKERFKVRWVPHEMQVLCSFVAIGLVIFMVFNNVRKHIPNEKQKLELKVRAKYKLNEKFQQFVKPNGSKGMFTELVSKEAGPVMDQVNHFLDLDKEEQDLFIKYRSGHNGEDPIEDRFFDYFQANQTTSVYTPQQPDAAGEKAVVVQAKTQASVSAAGPSSKFHDEFTIWMLAPLVFLFLGFDNGQMRRYFIGLVPNRYFELSLTVLDMLDDAIGKYLRGTLMECALVGLTLTVGFILIGIPVGVAVAIGVISGLVNAIPFLGTVIGLIIGVGYALIAENTVPLIPGLDPNNLAIYVIVLVGIAHILDNIVFQPFVLGSAVNVHPIVVVVAIISGSLLMGLWGMLFAIPTVVVLKTAVETLFKELKDYRII